MSVLRLPAPAKLNLVLVVKGRRPDGYHSIETLYHAVELADDLWAGRSARAGPSLEITAADARCALPVADDNLVLRAARAFAAHTGIAPAFHFALHKRIPPGGGLGGGSSDAAAALRLCDALCGTRLDGAALHGLARTLGADVAFFLRGGSQWGRGIGDELEAASGVPARHFLLLVPPFSCATAAVYKNFAAHWNESRGAATVTASRDHHHEDPAVRDRFVNDLEAAAERVQPGLAMLRARVRALGVASPHMTGSGATLFVAAADEAALAAVAARLQPLEREGTRLISTRTARPGGEPEPAAWPGRAR